MINKMDNNSSIYFDGVEQITENDEDSEKSEHNRKHNNNNIRGSNKKQRNQLTVSYKRLAKNDGEYLRLKTQQCLNSNNKIRKIIEQCEQWELRANLQKSRKQQNDQYNYLTEEQEDGEIQQLAKKYKKNVMPNNANLKRILFTPKQNSIKFLERKSNLPKINDKIKTEVSSEYKYAIRSRSTRQVQQTQRNSYQNYSLKQIKLKAQSQIDNYQFHQKSQSAKNKDKSINEVCSRYRVCHYPKNASRNRLLLGQQSHRNYHSQNSLKQEPLKLQRVIRHLNNSPKINKAYIPNKPLPQQLQSFDDKIIKINSLDTKKQKKLASSINIKYQKTFRRNSNKRIDFMMINPSKIGSYEEIMRQRMKEDETKRLIILKSVIRDNIKKKNQQVRKNFNRKKINNF